jgi:hypothetical protein
MSIADKLTRIAENEQKVYEAGKKAEYNDFWDEFQQNGKRDVYYRGLNGQGWTYENLRPKYDIIPDRVGDNSSAGQAIFSNMSKFYGSLKDVFDGRGVKFDTSYIREPNGMFDGASNVTEVPHIDLSSTRTNASSIFYGTSIKKITITLPDRDLNYNNCFRVSKLEELEITGVLRGTNISFQWSPNLKHDGIVNIINALSTTTSGLTVTFSKAAVQKAFETSAGANDGNTSAEWLALANTKSNWTISLV